VIIDDILANKAFHGQSAVGKRILIASARPSEWVEVVGVVAHQRAVSLADPGREQVYFTDGFMGSGAVDSGRFGRANDPAGYGSAVRAAIKEVDAHLLVTEMQPVERGHHAQAARASR